MTNRHAGYVLTLAEDVREDDAEVILSALCMIKGVVSVEPVVADIDLLIAQQRASHAWRERIYAMLRAADR